MVNKDKGEELYHGVDILKDYIDSFVITKKPVCSFQDWEKLCYKDGIFHNFLINFIDIIIFDAIIGNTDRHTENWAFIKKNIKIDFQVEISSKNKYGLNKFFGSKKKIDFKFDSYSFAPIYDSGSCLGREKDKNIINDFLSNSVNIEKYILNGKSEIKWGNKSLNLFDIAKEVYYLYNELFEEKISKLKNNDLLISIHNIIDNVDINVPKEFENFKLSLQRKKMIYKIIEHRINYLNKILVK